MRKISKCFQTLILVTRWHIKREHKIEFLAIKIEMLPIMCSCLFLKLTLFQITFFYQWSLDQKMVPMFYTRISMNQHTWKNIDWNCPHLLFTNYHFFSCFYGNLLPRWRTVVANTNQEMNLAHNYLESHPFQPVKGQHLIKITKNFESKIWNRHFSPVFTYHFINSVSVKNALTLIFFWAFGTIHVLISLQ